MILAVNIGNSNVAFGLWDDGRLRQARIPTAQLCGGSQVRQLLEELTGLSGAKPGDIKSSIAASVVPEKTRLLIDAVTEVTGRPPALVDNPADCGMDISAYDSGLLGIDRVVCCASALEKYPPPLVVFDFGTATTANVVSASGAFLGGAILPGVRLGLNALSGNTALLPDIELGQNVPIIGRNTAECLASGAVYGAVGVIEGFAKRISEALGHPVTVVVTGGNADSILPYCKMELCHEPTLLLDGLVTLRQKYNAS